MSFYRLAGLTLTIIASFAIPIHATEASGKPLIAELADMLEGEFDSRLQMEEDKANNVSKEKSHAWVNRSFVRINAPEFDSPVLVGSTLYRADPWIFDENEFLVWTFTSVQNGNAVLATPRRFKEQHKRLPFARDANRLAGFSAEDLEPARSGAACPITWTKTETGFYGKSTDCRTMSTVHKKLLNWEWRYQLRSDALSIEFFGTDDSGKTLDGTPDNIPYRLNALTRDGVPKSNADVINAVLRTATIYVKNWDSSVRFYTEYLGYKLLVENEITDEKSLTTIGAGPKMKARIAYLKPVNNRIERPFSGNYLGLIEISGPGADDGAYRRISDDASAAKGEIVLAHQVVGIKRVYAAMQADEKIQIIAPLSPSGAGLSQSFSVLDPNGVRVEIYEYAPGKEPKRNP
ncbi:MAG: VOC family protein [Parasphingorhabdus sp.]|uniref:VOC family protein n=1 Tax=Parasphingorhabdus sp. TaxID=2709688 RepID=UPI003298AFE9